LETGTTGISNIKGCLHAIVIEIIKKGLKKTCLVDKMETFQPEVSMKITLAVHCG